MKKFIHLYKKELLLFAIIILIIYANVFDNDFLSDDLAEIVNNPKFGTPQDLFWRTFYYGRPTLYYLTYLIFGLNSLAFHALNVAGHIIVTGLVFAYLLKITGYRSALIAALIFAMHPLLNESIVWVSGGIYVEYAIFMLVAVLYYLRAHKLFSISHILSLTWFLAGLATIEKATALPFLLTLHELFFGDIRKRWKLQIPYYILSMAWAVGIMLVRLSERLSSVFESAGTGVKGWHNPLQQIPIALFSYFKLIVYPQDLTFYHADMSFPNIQFIGIVLVVISVFTAAILYARISKIPLFGLLFFVAALSPTLTPLPIAWIVAERYAYLGMIGIALALTTLITPLFKKLPPWLIYTSLIILLSTWAIKDFTRNRQWQSQDTLWPATAEVSPTSPNAWNNMGDVYGRYKDLDNAERSFLKAIELLPTYADAYHNVGNIYMEKTEVAKAEYFYAKAIEMRPALWQSHMNLGILYFNAKLYPQAIERMKQSIQAAPNEAQVYFNLAVMYQNLGNKTDGLAVIDKALELQPGNPRFIGLRESLLKIQQTP